MLYSSDQEIMVGDKVVFEKGKLSGTMVHVIESDADIGAWNIDEPGVMIETKAAGSIYLGASLFVESELSFISR